MIENFDPTPNEQSVSELAWANSGFLIETVYFEHYKKFLWVSLVHNSETNIEPGLSFS